MFEINGNLCDGEYGISNINLFLKIIFEVKQFYLEKLVNIFSENIDLYIDNATKDSGWTPVITPVFKKFLIIKLGISEESTEGQIAYQFAHEYMHYIYYCKYGLEKPSADAKEETICSAASLIVLHELYPSYFKMMDTHVRNLENMAYRKGAELAEEVAYNLQELVSLI